MGELSIEMQKMNQRMAHLENSIQQLSMLILKYKSKENSTWISEEEAAAMVGYSARVFREKVKAAEGKFSCITMQHNNGRCYKYSRTGIEKYLKSTSTMY